MLRDLFIFSLMFLNIYIIDVLKFMSCASSKLHFSGPTVVGNWVLVEAYCLDCPCLYF